jgi:hypothetical protein
MTALAEHPLFAALAASGDRQFDACSPRHGRPLVRAVAHAWSDRVVCAVLVVLVAAGSL